MGILFSVIFGLSILFSVVALFYTLIVHSWKSFLVLGVATLPISLYILSGEPPIQYIGFFSIICFVVSIPMFLKEKRKTTF